MKSDRQIGPPPAGGHQQRKRGLEQHRADADERERSGRPPLYLILDNIRSLTNVGSIFRAADGFGVRKIFLAGITPAPPRPEIAKIALGAERTVQFESISDPARAVVLLQRAGVPVLAVEQTQVSGSLYERDYPEALALVFGHETDGVDDQVLALADGAIEIPMYGAKHSHNVAVAAGIVLAEVRRSWEQQRLSMDLAPREHPPALPSPRPQREAP